MTCTVCTGTGKHWSGVADCTCCNGTGQAAPLVETYRVVQLTPAGETLAILITGCSVREARTIAADLGAGFHVRQDPPSAVATARAA